MYDLHFPCSMRRGWSLGNTLDASTHQLSCSDPPAAFETAWKNPVTTRALIDSVAARGFDTLRLPVTWYPHLDADGKVDPRWMERVREIACWGLDAGMHVIVNVHHDTGAGPRAWVRADRASYAAGCQRFSSLWQQIAAAFSDCGDKLLFEGWNEMLDAFGRWDCPSDPDSLTVLNDWGQCFVDAVRSVGSASRTRMLILNSYSAASNETVLGALSLPQDCTPDRLMLQVHSYEPMPFTFPQSGLSQGTSVSRWTNEDAAVVDAVFARTAACAGRLCVPALVGEFGAVAKENDTDRAAYVSAFCAAADARGIPVVWWDNGMRRDDGSFGLVDRRTLAWNETLLNALMQ